MNINNQLTKTLFFQQENNIEHSPYEKELNFYTAIQSGDTEAALRNMSPLTGEGLGKLSQNPVRNLKYHLIISIAIITRFCIEGGLEQETAYSLSDLLIQKLDTMTTEKEVLDLHRFVITEYTKRMAQLSKNKINSLPVVMCIDYIYKHYTHPITLKDLAKHVGLNQAYLSTLFKKETGVTITQYIHQKKINAAANMLKYSDYTYADIGNYLGFSSHSHFIATFKKFMGTTPKEYRMEYYSMHWNELNENNN